MTVVAPLSTTIAPQSAAKWVAAVNGSARTSEARVPSRRAASPRWGVRTQRPWFFTACLRPAFGTSALASKTDGTVRSDRMEGMNASACFVRPGPITKLCAAFSASEARVSKGFFCQLRGQNTISGQLPAIRTSAARVTKPAPARYAARQASSAAPKYSGDPARTVTVPALYLCTSSSRIGR